MKKKEKAIRFAHDLVGWCGIRKEFLLVLTQPGRCLGRRKEIRTGGYTSIRSALAGWRYSRELNHFILMGRKREGATAKSRDVDAGAGDHAQRTAGKVSAQTQ